MNPFNDEANKRPSFLQRFQVELPAAIVALSESSTMLQDFQLSEFDVACGRGKGCYNQAGNKRMRDICRKFVSKYQLAKSKLDKSLILSEIVEEVKRQNNGTAKFVKHDKQLGWIAISDEKAREKVGHALRQAIASELCFPDIDGHDYLFWEPPNISLSRGVMLWLFITIFSQ